MNLHLAEISEMVSPDKHAVLLPVRPDGALRRRRCHGCHHWNRLVDQPWRTMSIGTRDSTQGF